MVSPARTVTRVALACVVCCVCCGSAGAEALVDDRHDLVVVRAERVAALLAVAVVATDRGGREGL